MKTEKSLEEVREWKQNIYESDKDKAPEQVLDKIKHETEYIKKELNLQLCRSRKKPART